MMQQTCMQHSKLYKEYTNHISYLQLLLAAVLIKFVKIKSMTPLNLTDPPCKL